MSTSALTGGARDQLFIQKKRNENKKKCVCFYPGTFWIVFKVIIKQYVIC